jgi:2-oxoglutarate ferredoxin oxidoreductase subunit beta
VRAADVPADRVWVHDETDAATALVLAQLFAPEYPIPLGVLASKQETTYEEILIHQEEEAISKRGAGDIVKLLHSGETWQIK